MYRTDVNAVEYDQGLRSYLISIYNWMTLGLVISAASVFFATSTGLVTTLASGGVLFWLTVAAPFVMILLMAGGVNGSISVPNMAMAFLFLTVAEGLMISTVLVHYKIGSVFAAFMATAAGFAALSLWGYTTRVNLTGMGSFFIVALVGLIASLLINAFLQSPAIDLLISFAGVVIFAGLIAYDTQTMRAAYSSDSDRNSRMALWFALDLYLDFLNLFLYLLRFMGVKKD